ncbi:factor H binding family protein [Glaesserella parasuis]|nr:factor H binding family protein [Glaesserella parasuis]MDO9959769.1 factor H binding family protein [Glaesserella parasuis]MDP0340731.1 factor H binding family protein [Glaesserella parasuis]MDP0356698.1 factor H binding family protein [Glaesserella parasuis]
MSLKKVTLASLILLGLTACGSSGGGSSDSTVNQNTSQTAEQQAQADKLAAEKAEKERLAKKEAERLAAEQAEKERLAKEEAERLAAEQAEKERLAKEEAERLAAEQAEKERLAKEEAERLAAEQAEKERLAKEEAERLAAEQAEKDRLAKEEAERLAAEEKARQEKLASLVAIAKEAGLTDSQAMQVAKNNMTSSEDQFIQAIETFKIDSAKGFSEDAYQQGFNHLNYSSSSSASNSCVNSVCTSWSGTTTTKYSVVSGDYSARQGLLNGSWIDESSFSNIQVKGLKTQKDAIPNEGAATYSGKAFEGKTAGDLTYNVDFATRVGSGSVSGLPVGQVTLGEAKINGTALSGKANSNGNYRLEFFGPNAEEIGGKMSLDGNNYGLAGTRGEIQK